MSPADAKSPCLPSIDQLNYLWDEYKYRHELVWNAIFSGNARELYGL